MMFTTLGIGIERIFAADDVITHERLLAEGFEPVIEETVVVDVVSAILYYRITQDGIEYRLIEITNGEKP